jgi:hypothetical protein
MKLFAHYDPSGKICSVTWHNAPEGVSLMLAPRPGELVTEIQDHNFTGGTPDEKALRDLAKNNAIAEPVIRSKLKKKSAKE